MSFNCIVAEDEELGRKRVLKLLENHRRDFEVVKVFENGKGLVDFVKENTIHLAFLDIEMPYAKGTEIIQQLPRSTHVIFTTAYSNFAVEAFDHEAIDYLLKPISQERFDKAVYRVFSKLTVAKLPSPGSGKITVKLGNKHKLIDTSEVVFINSSHKYSEIHDKHGNRFVHSDSLSTFEQRLRTFVQIHRGILINPDYIVEISSSFNSKYKVKMSDKSNTVLTSGRTYIQNIKDLLT
ncbi:MAG: response regulator transcription factor [Bacteroidia bacterium]|nr:response regulator transcription factor [Bacteroidia bacterium]